MKASLTSSKLFQPGKPIIFGLAGMFLLVFGSVQAATIVATGDITGGSMSYDEIYSFDGEPDGTPSTNINFFTHDVTGLEQFDPALGTVTGITVSASITLSTDVKVEVFEVDVFSLPHSAGFTMTDGTTTGVSAFVRYQRSTDPPNTTRNLLFQHFDTSAFCTGAADSGECMDTDSNIFSVTDTDNVFDNPTSVRNLLPADYLGTGTFPVGQIKFSSVVYDGQLWDPGTTTTNILEASGGIDVTISSGTVSLTYEYTPIPIPAAAWMFASALGLLGWLRRRTLH